MKRFTLIFLLPFFFPFFIGAQYEPGKLYVTITSPESILHFDENNQLYSYNNELNELISDYNIIGFGLAFPSSQVLTNAYEIECDCNEDDLLHVVSQMNQHYLMVEKVPEIVFLSQPNDYNLVFDPDWALDLISAITAWSFSTGNPTINIGITDSNYDFDHEELIGAYDYADTSLASGNYNHGTSVAITASGNTNNNLGKSSIGYNTRLSLYGAGFDAVLAAAYNGSKVINMSWYISSCTFTPYHQGVMNEVYEMGVFLVASAGNGGTCGGPDNIVYPASYEHVFSVSSVGSLDNHERFIGDPTSTHQHNDKVDLVAPGYDVPVALQNNAYATSNGSSIAAPFVSGTAALMLSVCSELTPDELEIILKCSSDNIDAQNPDYIGLLGAGRLNAARAVQYAQDFCNFNTINEEFLSSGIVPVDVTNACYFVNEGSASIPLLDSDGFSFEWEMVDGTFEVVSDGSNSVSNLYYGWNQVTISHVCFGELATYQFYVDFELQQYHYLNDDFIYMGINPVQTTPSCHNFGSGTAYIPLPNMVDGVGYYFEWGRMEQDNLTVVSDGSNTVTGLYPGWHAVTVWHSCYGALNTYQFVVGSILADEDFDYPNGLEITSPSQQIEDLNGDGVIRIAGTLVFKSNVNYTFGNKTIEFARDNLAETIGHTHSGVIIEHGAKVTANNVTFKGVDFNPCNLMWDGIQVWGDDYVRLARNRNTVLNFSTLKNGTLHLNNCSVRDAHIGVALYRVNMPATFPQREYGRGILHAVNTNFINNYIGVDFKSNNNVVNISTIKGSSFTCNELLLDQVKYSGEGSDVFIRLQGVRNPLIAGNNFNGNTSFDIGERGTGIRSYGAGYIVQSGNVGQTSPNSPPQPNIFNNLDQGIDIYSFGGAANTIRIKDNRFNNVYQGVTANGSNFDEISYNRFNIPAGDIDFNSWGIFLQTSSGFLATENIFNTTGTNSYTFGAVTRNVNLINGELYKNMFNGDFSSATQAEGTSNNQLQIDCNRYLGNNVFDWTVFSDNMANQGVCLPDATAPATNIFSECITADESNIFSIANFEYASQDQFKPDCSSLTILIDECQLTDSYANACPQLVSYPCPQCIVALGQQFDFTPPGLERNKIKGELIRRLAQEGDVQQLVNILTSEALPEDKKIIIPTRIKRKEYIEAREVLDSLEQNTFEDQKFVELFDVLITLGETERELDELTASELSVIEGVAYSGTEVAVQAEAVLAELNKTRYIRFPQGFPTNTAMMMVTNESETTTFIEQINVSVYPNPSEGDVIVKFEEAKNASGYLIDAMGRIVKNFTFTDTESIYEIRGLARGLYTLGIHYTDGTSDSKRILIK